MHRSLGVHLSFVRSVGMDEWGDRQLESMKSGGNAQLLEFWRNQGFPQGLSGQEKYDNEAMEAYRAYIKARSKGEKAKLPGHIGYKKRVRKKKNFGNKSMGSSGMGGMGNTNYRARPQSSAADDLFADLTSSLGSLTSKMGNLAATGVSKVSEQSQQFDADGLKQSVKSGWTNFSSWVADTSSRVASNLKDFSADDGPDL